MLVYKDRAFCPRECRTFSCHRNKCGIEKDTKGLPVDWGTFDNCSYFRVKISEEELR